MCSAMAKGDVAAGDGHYAPARCAISVGYKGARATSTISAVSMGVEMYR